MISIQQHPGNKTDEFEDFEPEHVCACDYFHAKQFTAFRNLFKTAQNLCIWTGESFCPGSKCLLEGRQHVYSHSAWLNLNMPVGIKIIPLMLCSGKFSATAGSLDSGPGHAVLQPQMGMNRCHFNYVPSLLFEAGRNVGSPYYPRNSAGTQQRRLAGQLEI